MFVYVCVYDAFVYLCACILCMCVMHLFMCVPVYIYVCVWLKHDSVTNDSDLACIHSGTPSNHVTTGACNETHN